MGGSGSIYLLAIILIIGGFIMDSKIEKLEQQVKQLQQEKQ